MPTVAVVAAVAAVAVAARVRREKNLPKKLQTRRKMRPKLTKRWKLTTNPRRKKPKTPVAFARHTLKHRLILLHTPMIQAMSRRSNPRRKIRLNRRRL